MVNIVLAGKVFRAHHRSRRTARGRTTLEAGQRANHVLGFHHLFQCQRVTEHGEGVIGRVLACLDRYLAEGLGANAILLHVLNARTAKELGGHGCVFLEALQRHHLFQERRQGRRAIIKHTA